MGLCGAEPDAGRLTHLTALEDETYPSTVCAQETLLHAKCHRWLSSPVELRVQSGASSVSSRSHFSSPRDVLCRAECAETSVCEAAARAHVLWLLCLINPAKHFAVLFLIIACYCSVSKSVPSIFYFFLPTVCCGLLRQRIVCSSERSSAGWESCF